MIAGQRFILLNPFEFAPGGGICRPEIATNGRPELERFHDMPAADLCTLVRLFCRRNSPGLVLRCRSAFERTCRRIRPARHLFRAGPHSRDGRPGALSA